MSKTDPVIEHAKLEATALEIFKSLLGRRSDADEVTCQTAFRNAKAFLAKSAQVASGEDPCMPSEIDKPQFVRVPLVKEIENKNGTGVEVEPIKSDAGEIFYVELPVDHDACALNLPADHPVNLRYAPRKGGLSFRELVAQRDEMRKRESAINDEQHRIDRILAQSRN